MTDVEKAMQTAKVIRDAYLNSSDVISLDKEIARAILLARAEEAKRAVTSTSVGAYAGTLLEERAADLERQAGELNK